MSHSSEPAVGHGHGHGPVPAVPVRPAARIALILVLVVVAGVTGLGLVKLWPDHATPKNDFAAPGVTFPKADVGTVLPTCKKVGEAQAGGANPTCGAISVTPTSGSGKGRAVLVLVPPEVSTSGLRRGDVVKLQQIPASGGQPASYSYFAIERDLPMGALAIVFVLVVAFVARLRGLLSLVALGFGGFVLVKFMLPALLLGKPGLAVGMVGCATIMYVVLYLAHGVSLRTSAALAGTLAGIGLTSLIGVVAIDQSRLSGVGDETGALLSGFAPSLDFQGLFTCAVIVAGLGVLNDVTITQASAVWELRSAAPGMGRNELFASAMRIGRDHIASTIYTIVFAYAGAALTVLLLISSYDQSILTLLSTEELSEEIIRTLASGIGLVLAVPITTAIAVFTVGAQAGRATRRGGPVRRAYDENGLPV
ncbi:MAG: YibE/F family protein [Nocardioidaceae bacterium]|nr:YibE/F family protein [Nocardioidaceae bacterium]